MMKKAGYNMSDIGNNIRNIRLGLGLSQQEFADELCVTQQAVGKWERGEAVPQLDRLGDFSDTFDVPAEAVLYDDADCNAFRIPVDRTEQEIAYLEMLREKEQTEGLTCAERFQMVFTEDYLKSHSRRCVSYITCTEYEYSLWQALRRTVPDYSAEEFVGLVSRMASGKFLQGYHNC